MPDPVAPLTVLDLARRYDFPSADGEGRKVGIVLPGGGVRADEPTFATYFSALGLPRPRLRVVTVAGATNRPATYAQLVPFLVASGGTHGRPAVGGSTHVAPPPPAIRPEEGPLKHLFDHLSARRRLDRPPGKTSAEDIAWTGEGMMDVLMLAGLVPRASLTVYVCPAGAKGLAAAVRQAAADGLDALSMSFSYSEEGVPDEVDGALRDAAEAGVTLCAASGNNGSTENGSSLSVGFPGSSPYVLSCGGTMRSAGGTEQAWNEAMGPKRMATGGGYSGRYPVPTWQVGLHKGAGRGVPDVAANASQKSGCWMWLQDPSSPAGAPTGYNWTSLGTSSSAPVWAALFTRCNQLLNRRLGHVAPLLYRSSVRLNAFGDVSGGNNIVVSNVRLHEAAPGWDACTGLGRPKGLDLLAALRTALESP